MGERGRGGGGGRGGGRGGGGGGGGGGGEGGEVSNNDILSVSYIPYSLLVEV